MPTTAANRPLAGAMMLSDGRTFRPSFLEAYATVDLPAPLDDGRLVVDLTLGFLVRASGGAWVTMGSSGGVTGPAGGDLSGTYPNPSVVQAAGAWSTPGTLTPSALTASVNNYAPGITSASLVRLAVNTGGTAYQITGLAGGAAGRQLTITNISSLSPAGVIRFAAESASSTAANRFTLPADLFLPQGGSVTFIYDGTASRWVLKSSGCFSNPVAGTFSEFFGNGVGRQAYTGNDACGFGYGAITSITTAISPCFYGMQAGNQLTTGNYNSGFGEQSLGNTTTTGQNCGFGYKAGGTPNGCISCIFIGMQSGDETPNNTTGALIVGSNAAPITDVYIGNGQALASPGAVTYHAPGVVSGIGNAAGADLNLAGGKGTGTGLGGTVRIQVAAPGSSGSTPNALVDALTVGATGQVTAARGDLVVATAGKGISIKAGSNAKIGTAVLAAGTVTVSNTAITANSIVQLTIQVAGGTPGVPMLGTVVNNTSFVINSTSGADTSTVGYVIFEKG